MHVLKLLPKLFSTGIRVLSKHRQRTLELSSRMEFHINIIFLQQPTKVRDLRQNAN